ncbi:MAG TPA: MYG1 family protein [Rhabdochlamydiaceae bacterium]|nr:MYG1 family protein [Rhabdochlamydiaceae bacterium]
MQKMISRSFGTHDGSFHADEVTACALLLVFNLIDRSKIIRTRDPEKLAECEYVCDVGGEYEPKKKRFDHHQVEYQGDLSSAGMIWLDLLRRGIIDEQAYNYVNRSMMMGIDAHDNGRAVLQEGVATFSHIIANFVPPAYDSPPEVTTAAFMSAVDFVTGHLQRLLERYEYIKCCREKVAAEMASKKKYLLFEEAMPWQENFFELGGESHPALFVIMPSQNQWKLRGIPPDLEHRMQVRLPLPEAWAGLRDEKLQEVSGIKGAVFCHKGRFISVWKTKEDVFKALEKILE